jgi:hypothetical protein
MNAIGWFTRQQVAAQVQRATVEWLKVGVLVQRRVEPANRGVLLQGITQGREKDLSRERTELFDKGA